MKPKTLTLLGLATATAISAAAISLTQGGCDTATARAEPPPPKVVVSKPEMRQVADYDDYNGWLKPVETVDVRARVRGHLQKVNFTDGDLVKKDQPLFELDPRPFQAEIDRSSDQVRIYEAQQVAAQKEEARLKELVKKGGASQSQVDSAEAESKSLEAQIDATKQEVKRKELDLEYSMITAPIAGRIGRAMLTVGNLVNAGGSDPVLTTIVSVDPVHVYFDVDERTLQRYVKARSDSGATRPSAVREIKLPFTFGLETEEGFPHAGVIDFANNQVDPQTGTIQIRGIVPNPDAKFVPGSRVKIRLPMSDPKPMLLVPDTAILTDQDKRYVLVIDDKNVVQRRDVELGKLLDDGMRVILERKGESGAVSATGAKRGITADDSVITQGIQMARLNYPVEPIRPAAAGGGGATSQPSAAAPTTAATASAR
jgi:RND family efflux transporter MFP subunit